VPKEVESKWRARWLEAGIYRWDSTRGRNETFVADSPPPPFEEDPFGAAVAVLSEVRRIKSAAKMSVKTPLRDLTIVGSAKDLAALRSVLGDVLSAANASSAALDGGTVVGGRFQVQATVVGA
jgi:valyl-tRNA synthetase